MNRKLFSAVFQGWSHCYPQRKLFYNFSSLPDSIKMNYGYRTMLKNNITLIRWKISAARSPSTRITIINLNKDRLAMPTIYLAQEVQGGNHA